MIRRNRPPPPEWKNRFDRASALIDEHGGSEAAAKLDAIGAALEQAVGDERTLATSLTRLDPDRIARELKEALRKRSDPTAPDDALISSLRQRYELQHSLTDRLEALGRRIEQTLVDLDALAARTIELSLVKASPSNLDADLVRLTDDIAALTAAHQEIAEL